MRIFLLVCAMAAVSRAQTDCSVGACYPPVTDLLQGRGHQLSSTSTCGLTGSEIFCTPYQQIRMKCCPCDSQNPDGPLAHTIKEVLSSAKPDRWWQSRKEVNPVTLLFDPQNIFQLDNLVLNFKGPRPSSLVIERSTDNGDTWEPSLYMSTDCQKSFPGVRTTQPRTLDETYCLTLPPTAPNPYQDQTIHFIPLRQYSHIELPDSEKIAEVSAPTALRVRLTELGDVPRPPGRALSRFYALKDMRVMGTCLCHGHANRCLPEGFDNSLTNSQQADCPEKNGLYPGNLMVGAQAGLRCDCQHNTAGPNCDRCADLYQDKPWKPAEENDPHVCQRCECNNHAQRCHFDPQLYEASGRVSGGVCDECMHHTTGPKCDQCAPGYQPNPRSQMDRPDACIRCFCNADGSVNGGRCDDDTGTCVCKLNVEGSRCDRCKKGFHSLSPSNHFGCSECSCSSVGSLSDVCDPTTGQCRCKPHFHGLTCDVCANGYWRAFQTGGCEPCRCDPSKSLGESCNMLTGQCECKPGFGGRRCTECPDNSYGDPLIGCKPCLCNKEGTLPEVCNKQTGACLCRLGVGGTRCDSCRPGHCDSFPDCMSCPLCYFDLDSQLRSLSSDLQKLSQRIPTHPGGTGDLGTLEPRIRELEKALKQVQDSTSFPPEIALQIDQAIKELDQLRDRADEADKNLPPFQKTPGLAAELDRLRALLDGLTLLYNKKKDAQTNVVNPNNEALLAAIKKAYDDSNESAKMVDNTDKTVRDSAQLREDAMNRLKPVQPVNTRDLEKLNASMANQPDLTNAAKQVCGSALTEPCTPLSCAAGDVCPPEGAPVCEKEKCVGALPLSKKSTADVKVVTDRLDKLSSRITEAAEKFQDMQEKTNQVRQTAEKLSDKIKKTRDELDDELKDTNTVLKELKDILSGPSPNVTQIEDIHDKIMKLPLSQDALKKKLEELKNLAGKLPDSTDVLNNARPQLDAARKLLQEAQKARDAAVNNDVDKLVNEFGSAENVFSDLEEKLQDSLDSLDDLNITLTQAEAELIPAEKALDDASVLLKPMKPQVLELNDRLQNGQQIIDDALRDIDGTEKAATAAEQDLVPLEEKLQQLKDIAGKRPTDAETPGDRLAKLQQDAAHLTNTTDTMADVLKGKADSIKQLEDNILKKSMELDGLEEKLKTLLATLRKRAEDLSGCQS